MFKEPFRTTLSSAAAVGTYAVIGHSIYCYIALRRKREALELETGKMYDALLIEQEAKKRAVASARREFEDEWTKIAGLDRIWKDRLMRFFRTKLTYDCYEKLFPEIFLLLNDVAEKFEGINEGLHRAQESEFVHSKGHVLSLLLSAQIWQSENSRDGSLHGMKPSLEDLQTATKSKNNFYHCQRSFLRFLFRSDPFVGAVNRFSEHSAAACDTGDTSPILSQIDSLKSQMDALHRQGFSMAKSLSAKFDSLEYGQHAKNAYEQWVNTGAAKVFQHAHKALASDRHFRDSSLQGQKAYLSELDTVEDNVRKHLCEMQKVREIMHAVGRYCAQPSECGKADFTADVQSFEKRFGSVCQQRRAEVSQMISLQALKTFHEALMINLVSK